MNKENLPYVYGPVPSRRLGQSLGVSPIPPKTCNYSCVYCQIGRTTNFTNTRQDFFPREDILDNVIHVLESDISLDYITFVGEGEPTLCKSLGWLIDQIKALSTKPISVITNGALLSNAKVRNELLDADVILPTLDAVDQSLFKRVNRPIKGLHIDDIIDGMSLFREMFSGEIWMEVMLVKNLNDGEENIADLKKVLDTLHSDRVYVNVPIRPPAEPWVQIPPHKRVMEICETLGATNISNYEDEEGFHIDKRKRFTEQILTITQRHPLRENQIMKMTDLSEPKVKKLLQEMAADKKLRKVIYNEKTFWISAESSIKDLQE
ncbi:MAG: radical SAM protein [Asgard group archaeon]|nr:radical SAM protein [Asgard group archaeon]